MILPGSWRASGRRYGADAADIAAVKPTVTAVVSSRRTPACVTTLDPGHPLSGPDTAR